MGKMMSFLICCVCSLGINTMEKKLAEYKCDTNEAISLKLGMFLCLLYYILVFKILTISCIGTVFWSSFALFSCLRLIIFYSQFASQRMLMMMARHSTLSTATSFLEMSKYFTKYYKKWSL